MKPLEQGQPPTPPPMLKDLVQQHQVCWEVWPLRHVDRATGGRTVGYQLELLGTHHEPSHTPGPGCDECSRVYEALREIAKWIMPKQERGSVYRVAVFDHALRQSPRRGFRKDVELVISLQHRSAYADPVDECEVQCLREMERNLQALGARKRRW